MADGSINKAIPPRILAEIQETIRRKANDAEKGWESAPNSEDTLTGDLGSAMRTCWSEKMISEGYIWRWRLHYRKFSGGNQHSSEEKPTGSDGIFQIEVEKYRMEVLPSKDFPNTVIPENIELDADFRKGILFQSKRYDSTERQRLVGQLEEMEKLTPKQGAYFEYGPKQYKAAAANVMIGVDGFTGQLDDSSFIRLGDFLADEFLQCKIGVEGMYFDFDAETLYFPRDNGDIARVRAKMKHGFKIEVRALRMVPYRDIEDDEAKHNSHNEGF